MEQRTHSEEVLFMKASTKREMDGATPDTRNGGGNTSETALERMERYTNHLEKMLLRKNETILALHGCMLSRIEEEIEKAKTNERVMIHQARQAALGELLSVAAHHWRQPLNVLALLVQNMKETWETGAFDGKFLNDSLSQLLDQTNLLSKFLNDFRGFYGQPVQSGYFDPKQCVEETLALISGWLSSFSSYDIRVTAQTKRTVLLAGCRSSFQQVIFSLLRNADEALQEQRLKTGSSFRGEIEISLLCADDIVVCVANNGGEIHESAMEYIFDPYFTTRNRSNGFGIGLYLSRLIVENYMDGSIWAENRPGGALFGIRLPAPPVAEGCA